MTLSNISVESSLAQSQQQMVQGKQAQIIKQLDQAKAASKSDPSAVKEQAVEFEAMFLAQMMQDMFSEVSMNPFSPDGHESRNDYFKQQFVQEMANVMAKSGGIGIADSVMKTLLTTQEVGA